MTRRKIEITEQVLVRGRLAFCLAVKGPPLEEGARLRRVRDSALFTAASIPRPGVCVLTSDAGEAQPGDQFERAYAAGASGRHVSPRALISGTPAELASWARAAALAGASRAEWLRGLANAAVKKLEPRK